MTNSSIVVGVGDDSAARGALDWAAAEALARGTGLELVRAFHFTPGVEPWGPVAADGLITDSLHRAAERRLSRAARYLASTVPGLPTTSVAVDGIAWDVLIDRSREGALVVLGSRRLSAGRAVALGSVSTVVAAKAPGPVVVVAGPAGQRAEGAEVVVGVDGSPASEDALAFAFEQADRHARPLRAVWCWHPDLLAAMQWRAEQPPPERAERWLAEAVAGWQEKFPAVVVRRVVVRDTPVAGLTMESHGAYLLVVGARGHHARLAPLLGSVSQGVLHHADCPVAVVHQAG